MRERRRPRVVIAANSAWNILNFRAGLIRALERHGYEPVAIAPEHPSTDEKLRQLPIERAAIRIDRSGLNPLADLRLMLGYRSILKRVGAAAFLGFTIKPNIYGCLAARLLGIPAVANISGLGTAFMKRGALRSLVTWLYRIALARAAIVFFQNPDDRALFIHLGIVREDRTRLLPGSGVDLDHFAPTALVEGPATFLLIARLLGDKGIREYAAAARIVRRTVPDARFQLLGAIDHENRTSIAPSELDEWVGEGTVEYLGEAEDVRPAIARATALVLPSYREGLPRSLLEGAAMGRPLIATDAPGCREVVQEGVNGYLCAVRDAGSLAAALTKFAQLRAADRAAMGAASRQIVEARFSETTVIEAYLKVLGTLVTVER